MVRKWLAITLSLMLLPTLWACSDDTEGTDPPKDQGVVDQKVTKPDKKVPDQKVAKPDKKVPDQKVTKPDQKITTDKGADGATADGPVTKDGSSEGGIVYKDGALPDKTITPDSSTSSCSLNVKKTLTMANGIAQVGGEILETDKVNQVSMSSTACTKTTTPGADHLYAVNLKAGTKYTVYLAHDTGYNSAFYVFTNCSKPVTSCLVGSDVNYGSDGYEKGTFTAKKTGTHYIGVDTNYSVGGSTFGYGTYKLGIMASTMTPANNTCAKAQKLAFPAGSSKIWKVSDTSNAKNNSNLTTAGCTKYASAGPDLFYKLTVKAGAKYTITLNGGGWNESLYVFTDCAKIASTCGTGMGDDSSTSSPESVSFTAKTATTYYIAVDGRKATDKGPFGLVIEKVEKPTNDTCATAKTVTLASGKASVKGDTVMATNTYNLASTGCTKYDTEGADVFYKVALTKGKTYRFSVTPDSSYSSFNPALYLLSKCAKTACVKGADTSSYTSAEKFTYKATATGNYYIVVDSREKSTSSYATGKFTLSVAEVIVPANNTCAKAKTLTFTSGKASGSGDTTDATNTIKLASTGCTGKDTEGPDLFYNVKLKANQAYKVTVTPASGYDVAAYILNACATSGCVKGADAGSSSTAETLIYTPTTAGTYTIGVDTSYAATSSYATGSFTIAVEEFTPIKGDTCKNPIAMTWASGKATASGDTTKAVNSLSFSSSSGCTDTMGKGPDMFYRLAVTAGKTYQVKMTPTSWDGAVYVFTNCAKPLNSCLGGSDNGYTSGAETVTFTAKNTGKVLIGVDAYSTTGKGKFTLEAKTVTVPANNTCTGAKALTFTSGKAKVTGDTSLATNTVKITSSTGSCTGVAVLGSDLWYKLSAKAGKKYSITVTPSTSPSYNVAYMVLPACATTGAKCITGADSGYSGTKESGTFTPSTTGDYYIVITSRYTPKQYSYANGTFTLEVAETVAPTKPANDTCAAATALTLTSGSTTVTGDNSAATNTMSVASSSSSCTSKVIKGGDMFYSLVTKVNQEYQVTLTPGTGFNGAIAVLSKCDATGAACVKGVDSGASATAESVTFKATSTGPYIIAVTSQYAPGATYGSGTFSLKVAEYTTPAGETCTTAKAMTFTSGTATATGDTTNFANDLNMSSAKCGSTTAYSTPGNDEFHKVTLKANQKYTVTLTPASTFDAAVYAFSGCNKPKTTCLGVHDPIGSGKVATITFTPTTAGTYFIGVDSYSSSSKGKYTLTVK